MFSVTFRPTTSAFASSRSRYRRPAFAAKKHGGEFRRPDRPGDERRPREFGSGLAVTGIRIEGEERPLDLPTEIRYQPGGRVPEAWIYLRDTGDGRNPTEWTLHLNPWDGSIKVLEGMVREDD